MFYLYNVICCIINWCALSQRLFFWLFSVLQLPVVFCVGLRFPKLSLVNFNMSIVEFVHLMFRQSCWWDFVGVAYDIIKKQNLTRTLWSSASRIFLFNLPQYSWALGAWIFCGCIHKDRAPQFYNLNFCFMWWSLCVTKRIFSDERSRLNLFVGVRADI